MESRFSSARRDGTARLLSSGRRRQGRLTATAARRGQQSGREGAALLERERCLPATIIVAAEADPSSRPERERERKNKQAEEEEEKNSPFLSLILLDAILQQMVEVEAFSSVHDMIQAALDKHGGTATLREVRLAE